MTGGASYNRRERYGSNYFYFGTTIVLALLSWTIIVGHGAAVAVAVATAGCFHLLYISLMPNTTESRDNHNGQQGYFVGCSVCALY